MKERVIDRTSWGSGPWDGEPDREQWKTKAGLPGLIVRNYHGALCGYAAVESDHPWYGKDWEVPDVDVHGGLTYADRCREDSPICHIPEPGETDDVWWFGFDCAHAFDLSPAHRFDIEEVYRDINYVRAEVESLAKQLVAARVGIEPTYRG